jgi:hypothetical protein
MKKICVFTQTYSNNRKELFDFHNLDMEDIKFRNLFDLNIYAFHDCDNTYKDDLLNSHYFNSIKNLEIISYNNISYTESWKRTLNLLLERGIEYLVFLQDDCFSKNTNDDQITEIYQFIKNNDFDMLNLECSFDDLKSESVDKVYSNNELNIYNTSSDHFNKRGWYSFDDGPYIASLDFIISKIYDDNYYSIGDIWSAENYINDKISKSIIQRYTTNIPIYNRYNILGRNNWNRVEELKILENKFK